MTANTVYDIFLALPEMERQRHIELVNEYKRKEDTKFSKLSKTKKKVFSYTQQDALDYLLKNVFTSKK
jgi:predicted translin family RNA/ssDNA-binding protein